MPAAARIAGFLLLFVLVTGSLSVQDGDIYAAGECNLDVSERKATQSMSENRMILDYDLKKMKEIFIREKYKRKSRLVKSRENYRARFVAFNADYKGPRHHPPKNN